MICGHLKQRKYYGDGHKLRKIFWESEVFNFLTNFHINAKRKKKTLLISNKSVSMVKQNFKLLMKLAFVY